MNPPRIAAWLAGVRLDRQEREFALGDLAEEFAGLLDSHGPVAARRWYWRQALRVLLLRRSQLAIAPTHSQPGKPSMQNFFQDVRFAVRLLRQAPAFTAVVTLTLALGIGATTAIYSVVHAALLKPLPYPDSNHLVIAEEGSSLEDSSPLSLAQIRQWRDTSGTFESFAGYFQWSTTLSGTGEAQKLYGVRSTASLFTVLGLQPIVGRVFTQAEELPGSERVVLLSEALWRGTFDSDPNISGRRILLNDQAFTVIGVLPEWFRHVRPNEDVADLFAPLRLPENFDLRFIRTVARLKPGQTVTQAQEQLLASVLLAAPNAEPKPRVFVAPLRTLLVKDSRSVLLALMGAVGFLLLITCANLANLLLARAVGRRKEIAVRLALGAGRGRIVTQLLTECVILSVVGGAAGVLVAWTGVRGIASLDVVANAGVYDLGLGWPVLAVAAAISLTVGVLFGLIPALQTRSISLTVDLRSGTRVAAGRERLRSALVVAEIALTLVLLVGAGLLTRSLANLLNVDKGFTSDSVTSFDLATTSLKYPEPADWTRFFNAVTERLARVPGVEAVGLISELPLDGSSTGGGVTIEGRTFAPGTQPMAQKSITSPGYFDALRIPVKRGRVFTPADTAGSPPVIVVSESFARQWFPGADPIGKRIGFNWDIEGFQEIVGVVADVKHGGLDDPSNPAIYVTHTQRPESAFNIVVRSRMKPETLTPVLRDEVRAVDADRPMTNVKTMESVVAASMGARNLSLKLVAGFALIGLVLAVTGIYGVVSYATEQRSREFGIRLALGAGSPSVLGLVLRQGLGLALAGLVIGLAGALALGGMIQSQLFGVEAADPVTLVSVSAGLVAVALLACYLPARRAVRISPASVLRSE
jgi:putative ABC transport system permease protein